MDYAHFEQFENVPNEKPFWISNSKSFFKKNDFVAVMVLCKEMFSKKNDHVKVMVWSKEMFLMKNDLIARMILGWESFSNQN